MPISPPTNGGSLPNAGFESGDADWYKSTNGAGLDLAGTDWTLGANANSFVGANCAYTTYPTHTTTSIRYLRCGPALPVYAGQSITWSVMIKAVGDETCDGNVCLRFTDGGSNTLNAYGNQVNKNKGWLKASVTAAAPAWATQVELLVEGNENDPGTIYVDAATSSYTWNRTIEITSPEDGDAFTPGETINLAVAVGGTTPGITKILYKQGATTIATVTTVPYSATWSSTAGSYTLTAELYGKDNTLLTSAPVDITIANIDAEVTIVTPSEGAEVVANENYSITATVDTGTLAIIRVDFYVEAVLLGSSYSSPYHITWPVGVAGDYDIVAKAIAAGEVIAGVSDTRTVTAIAANYREYMASNSYTFLDTADFTGLASLLPSTSIITGATITVDYDLVVMSRTKDIGVADPTVATAEVPFEATNGGIIEAILLAPNGNTYQQVGGAVTAAVGIDIEDFTLTETGQHDGKKWSMWTMDAPTSVNIVSSGTLFGVTGTIAPVMDTYTIGIRFVPTFVSKPGYADDGDAAIRLRIYGYKLAVSFLNGEAAYYFASADKTQVISADLAHYTVDKGRFTSGDAQGILQITNLAVVDGDERCVGSDWTVHAATPVTDLNQIAAVTTIREDFPTVGMRYIFLPYIDQLDVEQSRYQFISANFYADADLESMYGTSGADRAFCYSTGTTDSGPYFYTAFTTDSSEEEKPRHVAFHHGHLALGYASGQYTLSVAGEPYNYSGLDGAFNGSVGDKITGMLPLSGAVLGVFCRESIWGISGTTVDNFATQTLAPNIGAIEYTLADMGQPIYANAFGIYTLSQTQAYGDFMGIPMSQPISPYLKPRLVRDYDALNGVLAAFPVRSKNQYRLMFTDGEVITMTLNGSQGQPTFTRQIYGADPLIPRAISSQSDRTGKERIHVSGPVYVYEMDKGWDFDGDYIPCSFDVNWYFGDSPVQYKGVQKVRVYGNSRGLASIQVSATGQDQGFKLHYSEAQIVDLPVTPEIITADFNQSTNIVNLSNRGLSLRMKFEGRSIIAEPSHAVQVLVIESRQDNARDR